MKIASGKLDRVLELQAPTLTRDNFGQQTSSYAPIAVTHAQRLDMRTQDAARAGGRETFAMARFLIRWRDGIATGMRILTDGKLYDIVSIEEPDRRATLVLTVEEVMR